MLGLHSPAQPLTPTLSPEGRGGNGGAAGDNPRPFGERVAVRPVRGKKVQQTQVARARTLRTLPTDAETRLWYMLRNRQIGGAKFVRQVPIPPYFADFVCRESMLVIEVDGGQHSGSRSDAVRTKSLNERGYSVLRFWNTDVLSNADGIHEAILSVLCGDPLPGLRYSPATALLATVQQEQKS
jgi:very-short-patch-repair endonuclease